MADKTMMRVDKQLLKEIKACKIARGESYAEVVRRLMKNNPAVHVALEIERRRKK
jgi:phage gp37-like protein